MGVEQGPREGEENYVQDPEIARARAEGEDPSREEAREFEEATDALKEIQAKVQSGKLAQMEAFSSRMIIQDLQKLIEKYENLKKGVDEGAEGDADISERKYEERNKE